MPKPKKDGKRKKQNKTIVHPTIFVIEGTLRSFDGTMLELHTQVTTEEWTEIVKETLRYKIFIDCLKETASPILRESWSVEDDWWRVQLELSISRMRNIDPLLVINLSRTEAEIKAADTEKMKKNAASVVEQIRQLHGTSSKPPSDSSTIEVSDL